jgi:hypothetical protein
MARKRKIKLTRIELKTREDQVRFIRFLRLLIKLGINIEYDAAFAASVKPLKSKGNKLISEMVFTVLVWHELE